MFDSTGFDGHESVTWINDPATGLRAVVALHSTALGPAAGGCRLWQYEDAAAALTDALRLSRGMSMKNAMAGLPFGGGKAVILGPLPDERRAAAFVAFGRAVEELGGRYVTAEDVGVGTADMAAVARATRHVSGLPPEGGGGLGDPSPFTARGVLRAIEVVARRALNRGDLDGVRVAVQGLGQVGGALARLLAEAGARLIVADRDPDRTARLAAATGARAVGAEEILSVKADILAPCALGGVITEERAARLDVGAVVGAANNQLATPAAGAVLRERGIVYAPDYVVNAGGILAVAADYLGGRTREDVIAQVDAIGPRLAELLARAEAEGADPAATADRLATARIAAAGQRRAERAPA